MLQYLLTGLAGIAIGVAAMRVWMMGDAQSESNGEAGSESEAPADNAAGTPSVSTRTILISATLLVVAGIGLFIFRSQDDDARSGVLSMASSEGAGQNLDDVDTMIDRLAKRLEENPDDGEGFRMLGWSYAMTGRPEQAIEPYKRALALLPGQANVYTGYGEALVGIAKDTVTPEAKGYFEKAVSLDPNEPRARYFLALWKAQNGQGKVALDEWIALANQGPANAPWQGDVRSQIAKESARLGIDVTSRLKAAGALAASTEPPVLDASVVQAARKLPDTERQAMINGMVEGLAAKLKSNPADADGWIKLIRSRMVLKQSDLAGKDLASARKALAADATALGRVDTAARELGVPGA